MRTLQYRNALRLAPFILAILWAQAAMAQMQNGGPALPPEEFYSATPLPSAPDVVSSSLEPAAVPLVIVALPVRPAAAELGQHRFWDTENRVLFAGVAGMATADFFVTHSNLAHGGKELNPLTRPFAGSTPALAANFAMETVGVIGVSYFFHKTGHHKLERFTAVVNIGGSASAVAYGLSHR